MSLSFSPQMNPCYAAAAVGCQCQRSQADRQAVTDRPVTVRQSANYSANGIDLTSLGAESPTNDARAENGKAGYRPGQQVESLEAQAPTTNVYPEFGHVRHTLPTPLPTSLIWSIFLEF